ncbi:endonuclease [Corallococcus sp. H22C18031201]|uniref:endonuclease/exonuclease/phosphatase family protein n=1 Tax=Citreicoccus inhibens TaxID=2849499 RepID=UPI000E70D7A4|nr:endonuclease/exonuclease/phosphatase family protein [Citreicoccus inhibens]MBU8899386.1 endonuclease/exonuclease/phosphatase family protein [Citreicoccus inhibens]RJS23940.1 endonuclease [Corallococcus sp. H22C18031201]
MSESALRIVTYNVRYFGHMLRGLASTVGPKRRVSAALAALEPLPDIVCLQEVETSSLRSNIADRPLKPGETQLQVFMRRMEETFSAQRRDMPYEAFYFRAHHYKLGEVSIYTTGLAVLVNTRTLQVDTHNVAEPAHITHHHVRGLKDRKQSRICAHMRLLRREDARPFHVFNTHLSLPTPFAREFWATRDKMGGGVNQLHEARKLTEFVRTHAQAEPFIVCGDFNSPPASPVFRYLTQDARLVCAQSRVGQIDPSVSRGFPTAGFMRLRMHLDHLFSSEDVRWLDTDDTRPFGDTTGRFHGLSDHVPLVGRFTLEGVASRDSGA